MTLHLQVTGVLLIALALFHVVFPKQFNWKNELAGLSLINRQMMQVHTFFIALVVLLMGLLCVTSSTELQETVLGRKICWGLAVFWFFRWVIQFKGYSAELWKGKRKETTIHILFGFLWTYITAVFVLSALNI